MKSRLIHVHERIKPYIHHTPVMTSTMLNELTGCEIFFKTENFQRTGSFKMRGALNAIMQLSDAQRRKGVVTHSSGNFAQALALAANSLGVSAHIVMPENAPQVKKDAVKGYEGIVIECPPSNEAREAYAQKLVEEKGLTFIHPSNDIEVILGQGTATKELLEEHPDLDYIFSPVGGGGLVAGTILAAQCVGKNIKVVGCEPSQVDDAYRSLQAGKIVFHDNQPTIADGLKTHLGDVNFPIIKNGIQEIIRIEEEEIIAAMQLIWERMKLVIEPSAAVAFAGVLKCKDKYQHKKVGVILSGGNVELKKLPF